MSSFFDYETLSKMGFMSLGRDVLISTKATFYYPGTISIGNHSRIDDFAVVSGDIVIGNYVHVTPHCILSAGTGGIFIGDYCALAYRVEIFAETDDYTGESLFSSLIPEQYKNVRRAAVTVGSYTIIGASSTVFPGVKIGEGAAIGAKSLVNSDIEPWSIAFGIPARKHRNRSKKMLEKLESFEKHHA